MDADGTGGLPNQQSVARDVGNQFRIFGGLPPLPREPGDSAPLSGARQRLISALAVPERAFMI
jgi:hypothetical protein